MIVAVEIVLRDSVSDFVPRIFAEHQSAKHRALGLHSLGRHPQRCGFFIDGKSRSQVKPPNLLRSGSYFIEQSAACGAYVTKLFCRLKLVRGY